MSNVNTNYDYVYNVGLLDDVHNYFPAFLYDSGRFQTPVQVFSYIRSQMNSRFNLPTFGARLAGFSQPHGQPQVQPPQQNQMGIVPTRNAVNTAALTALLTGLFDLPSEIYVPRTFLDPVFVTPSEQVISSHTAIVSGENNYCAICQDTIIPTDSCRRLNGCRHIYHTVCIDQWFQTNVNCPTCRMDIRTAPAPAAPAAPAAPVAPAAAPVAAHADAEPM